MTQPINRRYFALLLLVMVLVASAPGQDNKPLLGKWNMTSESSDDPIKWTLTIEETGGKLSGSIDTGEGEHPAKGLTYAAGLLTFKAPYDGVDYDIELKLSEGKLQGTWSGGGDSGQTSGTQSKAGDS